MMIPLQENPTLAIRLGPMAECRLYQIAHLQSFAIWALFALFIWFELNTSKKKPGQWAGLCDRERHNASRALRATPCLPKTVGLHGERSNYSANCAHERFGAVMLTSKAYIQQAEECLQLANASTDVYVKEALTELASDFKAMAKDLDQRNERWRETDHGLDGKCDGMKLIAGLASMDERLCSPPTSRAFWSSSIPSLRRHLAG
jgi:hypothetical protein